MSFGNGDVVKSLGSSPKTESEFLVPSTKPEVRIPIQNKSFKPTKKGEVGRFQVASQVQVIGGKSQIQVESPVQLKSNLTASPSTWVPIPAW